jgi:hypothetical protein
VKDNPSPDKSDNRRSEVILYLSGLCVKQALTNNAPPLNDLGLRIMVSPRGFEQRLGLLNVFQI